MEQRNLGPSGLRLSLVGLGCNNFGGRTDLAGSRAVVDRAIESGINFFDTADMYGNRGGSERVLGEILGARRKNIVLATKFGTQMDDTGWLKGSSRRYIMQAVEASLTRLKTDWIDLYQLHYPDPQTPIDETLRALDDLVRQGKVRYIGCSNKKAWEVADAAGVARLHGIASFISCQDEYSLLFRKPEAELIPAMRHYGLGLLPYFPLASGLLTGKYRKEEPLPEGTRFATTPLFRDRYMTPENWDRVEALRAFCEARGRTLVELAFSWLAAQPVVTSIIAGATRPEQIEANVAAVAWKLGADDLAEIDRITA